MCTCESAQPYIQFSVNRLYKRRSGLHWQFYSPVSNLCREFPLITHPRVLKFGVRCAFSLAFFFFQNFLTKECLRTYIVMGKIGTSSEECNSYEHRFLDYLDSWQIVHSSKTLFPVTFDVLIVMCDVEMNDGCVTDNTILCENILKFLTNLDS